MLLLATAACSQVTFEDVTSVKTHWGGYQIGSRYTLNEDVFLLQVGSEREHGFALSPEGDFAEVDRYFSAPKSVEERDAEEFVSGRYYDLPTRVVDVLPAGERIRCVRLSKKQTRSWFFGVSTRIVVYAEIIGGAHAGLEVDISDLSVEVEAESGKRNWPISDLLLVD